MDAPGNAERRLRELAEEVFFAGVGAVALTKDRADELVDELVRRGRMTRREAREVVDDTTARWRGEALRFGERTSSGLAGVAREVGLVTRREWEELELRLSQVEHRLRLLEDTSGRAPARPERPGSPA
ncbi:MAG: phasin family protein [Thermoleophilia bacterium]|nr:phasin family protein [Thermoleophilia bacterium]